MTAICINRLRNSFSSLLLCVYMLVVYLVVYVNHMVTRWREIKYGSNTFTEMNDTIIPHLQNWKEIIFVLTLHCLSLIRISQTLKNYLIFGDCILLYIIRNEYLLTVITTKIVRKTMGTTHQRVSILKQYIATQQGLLYHTQQGRTILMWNVKL